MDLSCRDVIIRLNTSEKLPPPRPAALRFQLPAALELFGGKIGVFASGASPSATLPHAGGMLRWSRC